MNNQGHHSLFSIKSSLVLLFILLIQGPLWAADYQQEIQPFMSEIRYQAKVFGSEAERRLDLFKRKVEKNAYAHTMRLCEGYRRFRNRNNTTTPYPSHGKYMYPKREKPRQAGPAAYHGKYMYSRAEALEAWAQIAFEGAKLAAININSASKTVLGIGVPGTSLKEDYLRLERAKGNLEGNLNVKEWLTSMYTLYLVNSLGFLGASMHCLDTMSQREINKFATTIFLVEDAALGAASAGLILPVSRIISIITRGTAFVLSPVSLMLRSIGSRLGITRTHVYIGATVLTGYLALDYIKFRREQKEYQELSEELISGLNKEGNLSLERKNRYLKLDDAYRKMEPYKDQERESIVCQENPNSEECFSIYDDYKFFIKSTFDETYLKQLELDQAYLTDKPEGYWGTPLTKDEETYLMLLNGFLGVVNSIYHSTND